MLKPSGESAVGGNVIAVLEGFVSIGKELLCIFSGLFNNNICQFIEAIYLWLSIAETHYHVI